MGGGPGGGPKGGARSRRGFTRQPENSKRAHFKGPALQKHHQISTTRLPREREERMKLWLEREKRTKFWAVWVKAVWERAVRMRVVLGKAVRERAVPRRAGENKRKKKEK